jgi:hypothetical protein
MGGGDRGREWLRESERGGKREREGEGERDIERHTQTERERDRERQARIGTFISCPSED